MAPHSAALNLEKPMATDEDDYYNSRSKQESQAMAAWCFIALGILAVLGLIKVVLL